MLIPGNGGFHTGFIQYKAVFTALFGDIDSGICTVEQLLTIPGIYNEEDTEDQMEAEEIARAIVDTLKVMPDYDVDENRSWWPYKDWQDLCTRVSDAADVEIGNEAQQYVCFKPEATSIFKMKITGASMGMKREVNCECYVKDKKVRYIKWRED